MGFRCSIGFHAGDFERDPRGGPCDEVRYCTRDDCNDVSYRTRHDMGPLALVNPHDRKSCDAEQTCRRCGETEEGELHDHEWSYQDSDDCEQRETCTRCGDQLSDVRTSHAWGDRQLSQDGDGLIRICRRCGEVQERER